MPVLPPQNILAWKICIEALHIFAFLSTVYRLWYRWKISRMWWDDYMVVMPLILDFLYSTLALVRDSGTDKPNSNPVISSYWLTTFLWLLIIWSTRIVLSLSLARVFPLHHIGRYVAVGLAIAFALTLLSTILMTTLTCTTLDFVAPKDERCIRGIGGYNVRALHFFFADYLSDVLIIVSSVVLLWKIRLRPRERFLVIATFSASILTLLSAVAFTVAYFGILGVHAPLLSGWLASLEVAVSLVVCNLATVITGIYRLLRKYLPSAVGPTTHETLSATENQLPNVDPSHLTFTEISSQGPSVLPSASLNDEPYPTNMEGSSRHSSINSPVYCNR